MNCTLHNYKNMLQMLVHNADFAFFFVQLAHTTETKDSEDKGTVPVFSHKSRPPASGMTC